MSCIGPDQIVQGVFVQPIPPAHQETQACPHKTNPSEVCVTTGICFHNPAHVIVGQHRGQDIRFTSLAT
ncbi:hypothetical protein SKAU_G00342690 [Synaphobranchus kaupii]|uniref:Uncharacterized protein n=1 Tax=Synaphobranchus kaupii TaxID=118154 RepID=A0A9Q1EIV5_SYNKA|nr:hypothetical protein SKAU_G00342690 [Synaphobranchus kaupii]